MEEEQIGSLRDSMVDVNHEGPDAFVRAAELSSAI